MNGVEWAKSRRRGGIWLCRRFDLIVHHGEQSAHANLIERHV
jgi:hypothetical protein